jgi:hypothetical protein
MRLLRLGTSEHVLLVLMHHIVFDGWSMGVLVEELGQLYQGYVSGEQVELSPLEVQYADYALWQRQWLQGEELKRQREYWQEQLQGAPGALELPWDHARPKQQSFRGGHLPIEFSKELSERLEHLGKREGATLYMVLLAAYQLLLSRWSGQTDVVVGSPIANRTEAASESLIGFFVNTLAIRAEVRGEKSFRELLAQVRERTLGAYEHQELPFEQVVELLSPERDLSRQPVFQVMLVLHNAPRVEFELAGLKLSEIEQELGTAKFDLTLSLQETEAGLRGHLEYARDLFEGGTMSRFVEQYERVLEAIVEDAEQRVGAIQLLSAGEREQVLFGWNQTAVSVPEGTVVDLFEEQAEKTPEAVAVVYEDEELSYG